LEKKEDVAHARRGSRREDEGEKTRGSRKQRFAGFAILQCDRRGPISCKFSMLVQFDSSGDDGLSGPRRELFL